MFVRLRNIIIASTLVFSFSTIALVPATTHALFEDSTQQACKGVNLSDNPGVDEKCTKKAGDKVDSLIATIINILSFVIGVIAVIVLIISGLRFILSSGDSNSVASARNGIIYALVGLLVVVIAQTLVKFVISKFSS